MYALEERIKAVEMYFRYGRKVSAVIRELGYPDRKMLVKWAISYTIRSLGYPSREKLMEWIDELAPGERIIHEGYLKRDKHPSMEKKKDCVMRLATRTGSAEEAGVSRSSLYTWKREIAHDINISMSKRKTEDTQVPIIISSIEEAEEIIARYEKSIAELEEKNRDLEERRLHAEIELACLEKAAELLKKARASVWKG